MAWATIATDGYAVGNLEFLSSYWQHQVPHYEMRKAEIKNIGGNENPLWENYDILSNLGTATFVMRKSIRPIVHKILGISETEKLECKIFQAYYKNRVLMGFTPLLKK